MLSGAEDENISNYFIETAFPPQRHVKAILEYLRQCPNGLSTMEMQRGLNITYGQLQKTLRYLSSDSPTPIRRQKSKWMLTPAAATYSLDEEKVRQITGLRYEEQAEMRRYLQHPGCLMDFSSTALMIQRRTPAENAPIVKDGLCCRPCAARNWCGRRSSSCAVPVRL